MFSTTCMYSSTSSPNSSLLYFSILMSTRPWAISLAASESCFTDFSIVLISTRAMKKVTAMEITAMAIVNMVEPSR